MIDIVLTDSISVDWKLYVHVHIIEYDFDTV